MIAIPIDTISGVRKSSKLFGNAPVFALYDREEASFRYLENPGCGNGIKTAQALIKWGVDTTVYTYLGDGPFNTMEKNGIEVHYLGKEPLELTTIIENLGQNLFVQVNSSNAKSYLDPGTSAGSCECGCSHD